MAIARITKIPTIVLEILGRVNILLYPNPLEYNMFLEVMLLLKFLYCFPSRFKCWRFVVKRPHDIALVYR